MFMLYMHPNTYIYEKLPPRSSNHKPRVLIHTPSAAKEQTFMPDRSPDPEQRQDNHVSTGDLSALLSHLQGRLQEPANFRLIT